MMPNPKVFDTAALSRAQDVAAIAGAKIDPSTVQAMLTAALNTPEPNADIAVSRGMVMAGRQAVLSDTGAAIPAMVTAVYRAMEAQRRVEDGEVEILPEPVVGAPV